MGRATEGAGVKRKIERVVLLTHGDPAVAAGALRQSLSFLHGTWRGRSGASRRMGQARGDLVRPPAACRGLPEETDLRDVDLCLVLGGDGTMLRGFHLTRDLEIPVAGVNLGRVGFLTTVLSDRLEEGLAALLAGRVHRTSASRAAGARWDPRSSEPPTTWWWAAGTARTRRLWPCASTV